MDSRGQASSVFQLLISAIVALAVLMILLSVLGVINFGFNQEPAKAAGDLLKDSWNNIAQIKTVTKVTFSSSANSINSVALAEASKVGISDSQICLSLGDFSDVSGAPFTLNDDQSVITFTGSGSKDTGISAFCYSGTKLAETIDKVGAGLQSSWVGSCPCQESEEVCCLVALRISK